MSGVCKKNVSKYVWKPFEPLLLLYKCFGEVSFFNLHYHCFNYYLLANIFQFYEDLAVITALIHSGYFGWNLVKLRKKNVVCLGRSILGKTVPSVLSTG